jgi:argininosuccinate lyase
MVMEKGMDFRSAHRNVGQAVSETLSRGLTSFEEMAKREPGLFGIPLDGIDPRSCVERAKYGGGPAPESMDQILESLHQNWRRHQNAIKAQVAQWKEAQSKLKLLVNEFSLA